MDQRVSLRHLPLLFAVTSNDKWRPAPPGSSASATEARLSCSWRSKVTASSRMLTDKHEMEAAESRNVLLSILPSFNLHRMVTCACSMFIRTPLIQHDGQDCASEFLAIDL
jgi:hypothetical protein